MTGKVRRFLVRVGGRVIVQWPGFALGFLAGVRYADAHPVVPRLRRKAIER